MADVRAGVGAILVAEHVVARRGASARAACAVVARAGRADRHRARRCVAAAVARVDPEREVSAYRTNDRGTSFQNRVSVSANSISEKVPHETVVRDESSDEPVRKSHDDTRGHTRRILSTSTGCGQNAVSIDQRTCRSPCPSRTDAAGSRTPDGHDQSAVSRLERGLVHRPTLTTIENYALVVGCRIDIHLLPWPYQLRPTRW